MSKCRHQQNPSTYLPPISYSIYQRRGKDISIMRLSDQHHRQNLGMCEIQYQNKHQRIDKYAELVLPAWNNCLCERCVSMYRCQSELGCIIMIWSLLSARITFGPLWCQSFAKAKRSLKCNYEIGFFRIELPIVSIQKIVCVNTSSRVATQDSSLLTQFHFNFFLKERGKCFLLFHHCESHIFIWPNFSWVFGDKTGERERERAREKQSKQTEKETNR